MFVRSILTVLSVAILATGCASLPGAASISTPPFAQRLAPLEQQAAAPAGLVQFCLEHANICGSSANASGAERDFVATGAAWNAEVRAAARPEDVFQSLLTKFTRVETTASSVPVSPTALSSEAWRALVKINADVNWEIVPETDERLYGVADRWAMPLTLADPAAHKHGDCEDYAMEKRARLLAAGWRPETLSLAVALAPQSGAHAVLIVHTDHGDFVLDNLREDPTPVENTGYYWVSMQTGANLLHWSTVQVASAPSIEMQRAETQASESFAARLQADIVALDRANAQADTADTIAAPTFIALETLPPARSLKTARGPLMAELSAIAFAEPADKLKGEKNQKPMCAALPDISGKSAQ